MNIIIVRHGQSQANAKNISQGNKDKWTDTPLSLKGKEQARKLANRLKNEKFSLIYSSDLKRAKQTVEEINKFHNLKIKFDKRLRDMLNNEDKRDFVNKIKSCLKDIEKEKGNVLVVAHGSSSLTLLAVTTGSKEKGTQIVREHSSKYRNTCVSLVEKKGKEYQIKYIGCTRHLLS